MSRVFKAHIALISANIVYGLSYVISKGIMPDYFTPRAIIAIRVTVATLSFWIISKAMGNNERVERKDLLRIALCAVFGIALNQIMFFEGLNLTTAINSSIIMTINPALVLIFAFFIVKEKITRFKIIGIILGAIGALYLIFNSGDASFNSSTTLGNVFIFINATTYALYLVLVKPLMMKYKTFTIMKWLFLFGLIYVLPFCAGKLINTNFSNIPFNIWLSLSYVVFITTVVSYSLYNFSLKDVSPSVASIYIYLQPLLAAIMAMTLTNEVMTIQKIISALFIFFGVYFVSRKDARQE